VRLGRVDAGVRVLDEVGQLRASDLTLSGLRDKANVALGYAWLQAELPEQAGPSLQRVRLHGPFANKALLGVGWADAERGDYRAALSPWLELSQRAVLDPAVQESLLAVPYAFSQLGANRQAADYYLAAIDTFNAEIGRVDQAIASVEQGTFVADLLRNRVTDESGWYWRLDSLPDSIESYYLYELVASNDFQEGLKNYRDLLYLQSNLARWSDSLGVFTDILDTRERAYAQRLPLIERSLDRVDLDDLGAARVYLESRLIAIERDENVWALGTPSEQAAWALLESLTQKLAMVDDAPGVAALRDKHAFLKGVLYWNLYRDYKARLWQAKRNLRGLEGEYRTAQRAYHQVERARAEWPDEFANRSQSIADLTLRLTSMSARLDGLVARQAKSLERLSTRELTAQRERLSTYLVQARFALAAIYDRSATVTSNVVPPELPLGAESQR
jgi:hypothetical protein